MRRDVGEPYYRISIDEAKAMIDNGKDAAIVDVRNLDEYTSGHVPNAIHIPVDEVLTRISELPKDRKLLFICAAGVRSGLACEMAAATGLDQELLFNIEEGTPAWIAKNYPTSYGKEP